MKARFIIILCMAVLFLSACGNKIEPNMAEQIPDFTYTTQDEKPFGLNDVKGDWWLAYFSYTHCTTVCPRTTANMVGIQQQLKQDGLEPPIVSFGYGADLETMTFLTGYSFETIQDLSRNTFKSILDEGALGQRAHSYYFYLVNPDGEIVKRYDGMSEDDNQVLVEDVKTVLN